MLTRCCHGGGLGNEGRQDNKKEPVLQEGGSTSNNKQGGPCCRPATATRVLDGLHEQDWQGTKDSLIPGPPPGPRRPRPREPAAPQGGEQPQRRGAAASPRRLAAEQGLSAGCGPKREGVT